MLRRECSACDELTFVCRSCGCCSDCCSCYEDDDRLNESDIYDYPEPV
jgi:hypothetical protein